MPASVLAVSLLLTLAPAARSAHVTVSANAPDVYLAIVAEDQPWSEPAYELISEQGRAAWDVPAGTWRIVAAGPRFGTKIGEPFTIADGDTRDVRVALEPLQRITGFVIDQTGHPIANASVVRLTPSESFSALAERHIRANDESVTAVNGAFTLSVPRLEGGQVLIEARGHAPAVADVARFGGGPDNTVTLQRGSSLRVHWRARAERSEKISLLPIDVALPEMLTRSQALRLWTRPIAGQDAQWDSLPAGTYQVLFRAGTTIDVPPPSDLGEVVLAPGDDRDLRVELPPLKPQTQPAARPIRILLPQESGEVREASVTHWTGGVRSELPSTLQAVSGGTLVTTSAPCAGGSTIVVESSASIGLVALDGVCGETLRMPLAPKTAVTARISVPRGVPVPSEGSLYLAKCAGIRPSVEIPVAIEASRLRANVMADCADFSLHVPGFAPAHFVSSAKLRAGETRDYGTLALAQGAVAALRVRSGRDAELQQGVRITAVRPLSLAALRRTFDIDSIALATATTDVSGWARLIGLPAEKIIFLLNAPGRSYPQVSEPYVLTAGEETVLDDLLLDVPSKVFVTVTVPEAIENAVEINVVEVVPAGHNHWPPNVPLRGSMTPTGGVIEEVPPGKWNVRAAGRLKDGFVLQTAEEQVDLVPGEERTVTLAIADSLYHGRITYRGQPVSGVLNLRPAERDSGRRTAVAQVGADGSFRVLLERAGDYSVFVQTTAGGGATLNHYVTFGDPEEEVSIELPTGRIEGRVIDSTGSPVEGATVSATQQIAEPAGEVFARNSADGRFVLDYVDSGRWELVAESKTERSEPSTIVVGDSNVSEVALVVDPVNTVHIRVVDAAGVPLENAIVRTEFVNPDGVRTDLLSFTRDDGRAAFRLTHAQQAAPTNIVIETRDGRLSCAVRRLDADQGLQVPLNQGEARLIARQWATPHGHENWLVGPTGCAVPFIAISEEKLGEDALVFRKLAAGRWSYVQTRDLVQLGMLVRGRTENLPRIARFVVEPEKSVRVVIDR